MVIRAISCSYHGTPLMSRAVAAGGRDAALPLDILTDLRANVSRSGLYGNSITEAKERFSECPAPVGKRRQAGFFSAT
jgi:hypothetical protein